MIKNLLEQFVMMDVDLEGGSGGGPALDDEPGYVHNHDVGEDDDDAKDDEYPTYDFGPSDEDLNAEPEDDEDGDTQGDGSEDDTEEEDDTEDPDSGDDEEDTGEEDDSAGEDEDDQSEQVTNAQILRAGRLGVPEDQVALFSEHGSAVFEAHLDAIESQSASQGGNTQEGEGGDDSDYEEPKPYEPTLSDDTYEESLVNEFGGMSKHINGQIVQTHKILENVAGAVMNQQYNQVAADVNEQIDQLAGSPGMGFETTLGAGTDGLVPKGGVADLNRQKVINEISKIQQERAGRGQPPMTNKRAFTEAVKKVTGKDISTHNKNVKKKAQARGNNVTPRKGKKTSSRKATTADKRRKAAVRVWSGLDD